eukprot:146061-Chlamydomonas_euryale.AAC.3
MFNAAGSGAPHVPSFSLPDEGRYPTGPGSRVVVEAAPQRHCIARAYERIGLRNAPAERRASRPL